MMTNDEFAARRKSFDYGSIKVGDEVQLTHLYGRSAKWRLTTGEKYTIADIYLSSSSRQFVAVEGIDDGWFFIEIFSLMGSYHGIKINLTKT